MKITAQSPDSPPVAEKAFAQNVTSSILPAVFAVIGLRVHFE
jgi:hypothetical protein